MVTKKTLYFHHFDGTTSDTKALLPKEVPCFQFPGLSSCEHLIHAVYTRHGGVSESSYRSLNTSFSTGDRKERVETNLLIIKATLGAKSLQSMNQMHGKEVVVLRHEDCPPEGSAPADAMITRQPLTALLVKQADCQAVILFDPLKKVISNVHCGWRGNTHNLLGAVVQRMVAEFGCRPSDLKAAIGPSLGPCCAEFVSHEQLFPRHFRQFMVRHCFFDLWALSRWQLIQSGVREEHIEVAGLCTKCRTDLFYSYRAEGVTGRFATAVMLI